MANSTRFLIELPDVGADADTWGTILNNAFSSLEAKVTDKTAGDTINGALTAISFSGNGANLTNLNAGNISTGTIANARTTATNANTASAIVARDSLGNFSAGTITASLDGNASTATTVPNGSVTPAKLSQPLTLVAAQASTSGTSIDFTGIPNWVKRVTVMFNGVSTNGASQMLVQMGSGAVQASGYSSRTSSINGANQTNANANGNGFGVNTSTNAAAAGVVTGQIIFSLHSSNVWTSCGSTHDNTSALVQFINAGLVPLAGTLDRIRITTANGTDTFDAGSIGLLYE